MQTTAHTLAFLLMLLALYPDHQAAIFAETQFVFAGAAPAYEHFSKLAYTMSAIQETLRLFPPVLHLPKTAMRDTTLPCSTMACGEGGAPMQGQVFVPRGTSVMISAGALHYNELYWDRPYDFDPSRFIDTEEHRWNRDAWVPFSGGGRQCMGQRFALGQSADLPSHMNGH